jgi:hypothetical protein
MIEGDILLNDIDNVINWDLRGILGGNNCDRQRTYQYKSKLEIHDTEKAIKQIPA